MEHQQTSDHLSSPVGVPFFPLSLIQRTRPPPFSSSFRLPL
uniref:Uncharacterized protein n=1 Tax=Nelumbo nucifera TaxID=4432 RepID=A0A822ZBG9_NELNU|nr:TPA_asm: hypothetical protein HUJ06_000477 [Nelumbo nucifera]